MKRTSKQILQKLEEKRDSKNNKKTVTIKKATRNLILSSYGTIEKFEERVGELYVSFLKQKEA